MTGCGRSQGSGVRAAAEFGGVGSFAGDIERNDHGAMSVGMNEIAGAHRHFRHPHSPPKLFGVDPGVSGPIEPASGLKPGAHCGTSRIGSVGDHADAAERLVHGTLHLAQNAPYPTSAPSIS